MPETRGDRQCRLQHLQSPPAPEMSESAIAYSVSEQFQDQSNPSPIRSSESLRECLKDIRQCMGETVTCNARLSVTPTAMATGGYGQEATYTFDPQQGNPSGYTIGRIAKAAQEIEDRNWGTAEGREENCRRIRDTIERHERARAIIRANVDESILPSSKANNQERKEWREGNADVRSARWIIKSSRAQLREDFRKDPTSFPPNHYLTQPACYPDAVNPNPNFTPVLLPGHSVLPIPDPTMLPIPDPSNCASSSKDTSRR